MASEAQQFQFNPLAPESLRDPIQLYKEMREHEPVFRLKGLGWFFMRHDDVMNSFRDNRLSADRSQVMLVQVQAMGIDPQQIHHLIDSVRRQMVNWDGAAHLRLRRQASPGFTPQALDVWLPAIRSTMNALMDRVQHQGHMDLVKDISNQLPPLMIAELLGVPTEDREQFQEWGKPIVQMASPTVGTNMHKLAQQADEAIQNVNRYMTDIIERRRHQKDGRDVLSLMIHSQEGGKITVEELLANATLILTGGHGTTTDQLSNGVHELLSHPEQLQKLRDDPQLLKSAVEEILRFRPSVPFMHRLAAEDFQLRGKTIKKGDIIFLGMASANRDPAVFPDPDRFDITRDFFNHKHLSFGFGPHHCLGAGLGRRMLEIAIETLIQRLPGLRLDETQTPELKCDSLLFRGFNSLHLRW